MIDDEERITTIQGEERDEQQRMALSTHVQQQHIQITDAKSLIQELDRIVFNKQYTPYEIGANAMEMLTGLVDNIQTNKIGAGYILWRIKDIWYEYYQKYLLDGGPVKRDGFYNWCIDMLHYEVDFVNDLLDTYDLWTKARHFKVDANKLMIKPLNGNVRQIAKTKLAKASRKIEEIQDNPRLSDVDKRLKIEEVEKDTKVEVEWLFDNPASEVIAKKKEEKGTPEKIHVVYSHVTYPDNQSSTIGALEIKAQGEQSVPEILRELHKRLKDITHVEVILEKNHMRFNSLDELANHQESQLFDDEVLEGVYFDETELLDDDAEDEEEEEEEEDEWDTYEDEEP